MKMCSYKDLYIKYVEYLLVILETRNNSHVHQQEPGMKVCASSFNVVVSSELRLPSKEGKSLMMISVSAAVAPYLSVVLYVESAIVFISLSYSRPNILPSTSITASYVAVIQYMVDSYRSGVVV